MEISGGGHEDKEGDEIFKRASVAQSAARNRKTIGSGWPTGKRSGKLISRPFTISPRLLHLLRWRLARRRLNSSLSYYENNGSRRSPWTDVSVATALIVCPSCQSAPYARVVGSHEVSEYRRA